MAHGHGHGHGHGYGHGYGPEGICHLRFSVYGFSSPMETEERSEKNMSMSKGRSCITFTFICAQSEERESASTSHLSWNSLLELCVA